MVAMLRRYLSQLKMPRQDAYTLPAHGRVDCTKCFQPCTNPIEFDKTRRTDLNWRLTHNPLAWGSINPEVIVLGFSKGPTQAGALANTPHDQIAYKGSRANVAKILKRVGLLEQRGSETPAQTVDRLIADRNGKLHFGSLIRCTVERKDGEEWKGSGGGMLDKFVGTEFGQSVTKSCVSEFLKVRPPATKLILMFGLGSKLNYVRESFALYQSVCGGAWKWINDVAYTDGSVTVVHVEHFASQGNLIPRWLGESKHERSRWSDMAAFAVGSSAHSIRGS